MSARCASCRYPLNTSDSVVCHECWSYFHIDCAQLVGFPLFVLGAEPGKNTFHCSTCQLLPLPVARDDSSDTSDDEEMPSRQLDFTLEGDADMAKEMNEMKGGIQDISDLCKDMLREINDLKSINLTLRCCIENLRHDNEQRDAVISELKLRIDLLEGKYFGRDTTESTDRIPYQSLQEEKEAISTPYGIECTKVGIDENLTKNINYDHTIFQNLENRPTLPEETSKTSHLKDAIVPKKETEDLNTNFYVNENKQNEDTELVTAKEEVKAEIINETNQSKQDWSWRGNKAVELGKAENSDEEEEEESEVYSEAEDKDTQSWQKLVGEIETSAKREDEIMDSLSEDEFWEQNQDEKSEEKEDLGKVRKSVRWDEGIADNDSESEADWSQKDTNESQGDLEEQKDDIADEVSEIEEETPIQEDLSTAGDLVGDLEGRLEAEDEFHLESKESAVEGESHFEINDGALDVQSSLEPTEALRDGEFHSEEVIREATFPEEESPHLEGEAAENGESRLEEPEFPQEEEVQPPETPPAVHTEEDLWMYLKDTVSSVHPSTVQEFVQNLIGTLQHVPEEYLKPVIDANIKRIKSPSFTDGEHLTTPKDEEAVKEDCTVNILGASEGENLASPVEAEDKPRSEETFPSTTEEVPSQFPGRSSALEATD